MPNSNQHILTPQSTEYLTSKIESDNFSNNSADLIVDSAFATDGTVANTPRIYRTGNVICYLSGLLIAQGPVVEGDLIATVPTSFARATLFGQNQIAMPAAIKIGATTFGFGVVDVTNDPNGTGILICYAGSTGLNLNDELYLNGFPFFTANE